MYMCVYVYLVNKSLMATSISEAERLLKNKQLAEKRSFDGKCEILRTIFEIYQQAGEGFIYFMTLRTISQGECTKIVPVYFVDFFLILCAELSTSFLISPSLASAKSILLFSMFD